MTVEWWQGVTTGNHQRRCLDRRRQRLKRRLHLDDNLGAERSHHRHIPQELNGVAETLLGVQQNGLAFDRLLAEPERLIKTARLPLWTWHFPAPLVLFPALFVITGAEQSKPPVPVRLGSLRLNC